jgi:hypothetical protein
MKELKAQNSNLIVHIDAQEVLMNSPISGELTTSQIVIRPSSSSTTKSSRRRKKK